MSVFKCDIKYKKIEGDSLTSTLNRLKAHKFIIGDRIPKARLADFIQAREELNQEASQKLGEKVNLFTYGLTPKGMKITAMKDVFKLLDSLTPFKAPNIPKDFKRDIKFFRGNQSLLQQEEEERELKIRQPESSVNSEIEYVEEYSEENSFIDDNGQFRLFQEANRALEKLTEPEIKNLQSTIDYEWQRDLQDGKLTEKTGQSYYYLKERDAERLQFLLDKHSQYPQEFTTTSKVTKYEKDEHNPLKMNGYNVYRDLLFLKSNKNKKSNLYNIIDKETGEIIAYKTRVLIQSKDAKEEIASKYGERLAPTKIFSANRSIAFTLYREKPSKAKYIAMTKKYLYDAIKFLNPEESNLTINLEIIEKLLNSYPEQMWDYINTTYSPEDSTNINASISLQNEIKFSLPKLGFIQEVEKITGIKLQGASFRNFDRSGYIKKLFKYSKDIDGDWGSSITIDSQKMTRKQLHGVISYYLRTKNYYTLTSVETNVRKYAEHYGINYEKLKELVFGDLEKALEDIAYNNTGNSDTIELSKWREAIRNYDWQSVELFEKPYKDFKLKVKDRIIEKFKDKELSNGMSHLDYFFSGNFNWLNINFNSISGEYFWNDDSPATEVGVETKMGGILNPFEMKVYTKPNKKQFFKEEEVFNRLAAVLHEPFHALHALSYGSREELDLRKAFDKLYQTDFGKSMMNEVFGSGYNRNQNVSYDIVYKEFTAFMTQLILFPKEWIKKTDLRSNDIVEFIEKVQSLQDKTYEEIIKTRKEIGSVNKIVEIRTEEKVYVGDEKTGTTTKTELLAVEIRLNFLEKLYNYLVSALKKVIPLSEKFFNLIADSKIVERQVIEDVFSPKYETKVNITYKEVEEIVYGEEENIVEKTIPLPEEIKKSKETFLVAMDELESAIKMLMNIDTEYFSSSNIQEFFTKKSFNQEVNSSNRTLDFSDLDNVEKELQQAQKDLDKEMITILEKDKQMESKEDERPIVDENGQFLLFSPQNIQEYAKELSERLSSTTTGILSTNPRQQELSDYSTQDFVSLELVYSDSTRAIRGNQYNSERERLEDSIISQNQNAPQLPQLLFNGYLDSTLPLETVWTNNQEKLISKFPEITYEDFVSLSNEERDNLLFCL